MNHNAEPEVRRVGTHTLRFVPPDVVVATLAGTIEPSEASAMNDWISRFAEGKPWIFTIADMTRLTSFPMRSRQVVSHGKLRFQAIALIGASRTMQIVIKTLHLAISMLRHDPPKPIAFVETETEGHAFINDCRNALKTRSTIRDVG